MKTKQKKNIGLGVKFPSKECDDKHCPFHAGFSVKGRTYTGEVVKMGSHKSATVMWERVVLVPKYQRYTRKKSKINVHLPPCLEIKVGDVVKFIETRPISKTKNFVIVEKLEK